ncbi:MAG: hypothetical protein AAFV29_13655, partial [Myxococcota bacterium]
RDCLSGRVCRFGACVLETNDAGMTDVGSTADVGAMAQDSGASVQDSGIVAPMRIQCSGQPSVLPGLRCQDGAFDECPNAVDRDTNTSFVLTCPTPGAPYCSTDAVLLNVDIPLAFSEPKTVRGIRLYTDWHAQRPVVYEVWASGRADETPGNGATRVTRTTAEALPWRCETGMPCDFYTPTLCCPNGRDNPVVTSSVVPVSKFDVAEFPAVTAQYWTLRVVSTDDPKNLFIGEIDLLDTVCVEPL